MKLVHVVERGEPAKEGASWRNKKMYRRRMNLTRTNDAANPPVMRAYAALGKSKKLPTPDFFAVICQSDADVGVVVEINHDANERWRRVVRYLLNQRGV